MVMQAILYKPAPDACKLNPELPVELDRILRKLLEKDRALRYQTARDLKNDLVRLRIDVGLSRLHSFEPPVVEEPKPAEAPHGTVQPSTIAVIEPWDSIVREGRDFAERGAGIMYWFRIPLGGISHPGGFRSLLQPALENRRITKIRFVLDSAALGLETFRTMVVPLVQSWARRTRGSLRIEEDGHSGKGRFFDPLTERTRLSWLFTDLSQDYGPSFKVFVDDLDESVTGLAEAEIVIATTTRSVRLSDGTQQTVRVPDTLLRARASADPKLVKALRSVARRWDFLLP
jgi:hypothetical protein